MRLGGECQQIYKVSMTLRNFFVLRSRLYYQLCLYIYCRKLRSYQELQYISKVDLKKKKK